MRGYLIMKRRTFIILFVGVQVGFIIAQIHKQSFLIGLSFEKQRNEKRKQELIEQKNNLTHQLCTLQQRSSIKEYAEKELGMKPIKLNQIKTVPL